MERDHPKKCAGCRVLRYCGAECQKKDWDDGHKVMCKVGAVQVDPRLILEPFGA